MVGVKFGRVDALWRYPVSSFSGERLPRALVTSHGFAGDRRFGIYDNETQELLLHARKQWSGAPRLLARLDPADMLQVSIDGIEWLPLGGKGLGDALQTFFGRSVSVHPYGQDLNGKPAVNLYREAPIHLLSRQSLVLLRRMLPDSKIDERRFRPNITLDCPSDGGNEPPEYRLLGREFTIGGVRLRGTRKSERCSFTTLQQHGLPEDRSVLRTIIQDFEKNFGIYCDVVEEGWIAVDDWVVVQEEAQAIPPIVVVGAGQAGASVVRALRDLGYAGGIELFGDESRPPYERPPLSKGLRVLTEETAFAPPILSGDEAVAMDIDMHLGESVVQIDRASKSIETADGVSHPYSHLIIATGGAARRVRLLNRGFGRVHSIRTAADAEELRRSLRRASRIFVLGGGWLGLEIAAAAREAGIVVSLFARQAHLCARVLPPVVADFVMDVHLKNGVTFHMNAEPRFEESAGHVAAHLENRVETADLLVVAIGMTANDYLARQAGLKCRDGILTDSNGATGDPFVFAVGDVSRQLNGSGQNGIRMESWQNANEQAVRAAHAILGIKGTAVSVPSFWSEQYSLNIQIAGLPDPAAVPLSVDGADRPLWRFDNFVVGINRPRDVREFATRDEMRVDGAGTSPMTVVPKGPTTRHYLGRLEDLGGAGLTTFDVDVTGRIVLVRDEGRYFAMQDKCPHADASLSEGFVEKGKLVCPLHFAEFDLVDGKAHNAPKGCPNAATYAVEIEEGNIYVVVPASGSA
ncbi:MAG: FAD-dependent oxidoreductase [Mesorhizobium sp.]|nr:FAD-dependent oxidoreductase [Mesorhizobium sp.]MBL8575582.1 FAD-dependent oxidoreductase [Mesorhizobium sp.]